MALEWFENAVSHCSRGNPKCGPGNGHPIVCEPAAYLAWATWLKILQVSLYLYSKSTIQLCPESEHFSLLPSVECCCCPAPRQLRLACARLLLGTRVRQRRVSKLLYSLRNRVIHRLLLGPALPRTRTHHTRLNITASVGRHQFFTHQWNGAE
jgi:hypothetical protein